jgi:polyhydroxybutyrate depolymerase
MSVKADQAGFIVVYPQAVVGGNYVWYNAPGNSESGVEFIRSLIEHLQGYLNIDPKRTYATGLSAGGGFAYLLGCELADELASIAAVAGTYEDRMAVCEGARAIPVLIVHG